MKIKSTNVNAGQTTCLGWCNEKFMSEDKFRLRFCPKCIDKKEQIEKGTSKHSAIKICMD